MVALAAGAWVARWLALELAAAWGHLRRNRPGPSPLASPVAPGWMAGPESRKNPGTRDEPHLNE